jgi:hypothetical protein
MEFDRNRYFMLGILILLMGIQFRMVESFVLNETSTRALAKIAKDTQLAGNDLATQYLYAMNPAPKKTITLPTWLGRALLAVGVVICLHALVLPKPNG